MRWFSALKVFLYGFALDFFYVGWMMSVQNDRAMVAGLFSVMVAACGMLAILESVERRWLVPFYLAGLFLGTVASMAWF